MLSPRKKGLFLCSFINFFVVVDLLSAVRFVWYFSFRVFFLFEVLRRFLIGNRIAVGFGAALLGVFGG